jgi:hypothetical protein
MSLLYSLAQAQQPQKLPWGFLVLFALLALVAVGLIIYFLTRVRKSEKDAEEEWGLSGRGILLAPTTSLPEAGKKIEARPEGAASAAEPESPVIAGARAPEPEKPVTAAAHAAEPQSISSSVASPEPPAIADSLEPAHLNIVADAEAHRSVNAVEANPPVAGTPLALNQDALNQVELHQETVTPPGPQVQHPEEGSPFDEEVWSQLESPEPAVVSARDRNERRPAIDAHKAAYEPPRIDPIVPHDEPAVKTARPGPDESRPLAAASQQSSAGTARLEARPPVARSAKAVSAAAGSILGLPSEASAGPLIIDRSAVRSEDVAVGTLANYDKTPDDAAGHSGTIALLVVIVLICGCLAAYFALPSVHASINHWVARVRGVDDSEPSKPVAQIFATMDESKERALAKGTLQNISDQSLTGLVVTISLEPRGGGAAVTQDLQVTPDEIPPGQQGAYEVQVETRKYQSYRIVGLKTKDGVNLAFVKPNQQQ